MHARFLMFAVAPLALAGAAAAQPAKPADPPKADATASSRPVPVVLASADEVVAPSAGPNAAATAAAKRPRAMRVTTCRCGGDPQTQAQEQQ